MYTENVDPTQLVEWFAERVLEEVGDRDGQTLFVDELRLGSPRIPAHLKMCRKRLVTRFVFETKSSVLILDIDSFIADVVAKLKNKVGVS